MNGADVGMIERGCSPGFASKTLQRLWITGYVIGQKLQRNKPAQARVLGLIDDTHPASPELFKYAVVRDCRVNHVGAKLNRCMIIGRLVLAVNLFRTDTVTTNSRMVGKSDTEEGHQSGGSNPILSFTAARIRCLQPRYRSSGSETICACAAF